MTCAMRLYVLNMLQAATARQLRQRPQHPDSWFIVFRWHGNGMSLRRRAFALQLYQREKETACRDCRACRHWRAWRALVAGSVRPHSFVSSSSSKKAHDSRTPWRLRRLEPWRTGTISSIWRFRRPVPWPNVSYADPAFNYNVTSSDLAHTFRHYGAAGEKGVSGNNGQLGRLQHLSSTRRSGAGCHALCAQYTGMHTLPFIIIIFTIVDVVRYLYFSVTC